MSDVDVEARGRWIIRFVGLALFGVAAAISLSVWGAQNASAATVSSTSAVRLAPDKATLSVASVNLGSAAWSPAKGFVSATAANGSAVKYGSSALKVTGTVNTKVTGTYHVTYTLTYTYAGVTQKLSKTIAVTTKPVHPIVNQAVLNVKSVNIGRAAWSPAKAFVSAKAANGAAVKWGSSALKATGTVNTKAPGTYKVTYTLTYKFDGVTKKLSKTVNVTTNPYKGDPNPVTLGSFASNTNNVQSQNINVGEDPWWSPGNSVYEISGNVYNKSKVAGSGMWTGDDDYVVLSSVSKWTAITGTFFVDDRSDAATKEYMEITDPVTLKVLWTSKSLGIGQHQAFNVNIKGHVKVKINFYRTDLGDNQQEAYEGILNGVLR